MKSFIKYILSVSNERLDSGTFAPISGDVSMFTYTWYGDVSKYKIQKIGDPDPGWTNLINENIGGTGTPIRRIPNTPLVNGDYRIFYQDSVLDILLAEFSVIGYDEGCSAFNPATPLYSEYGDIVTTQATDTGFNVTVSFIWSDNGNEVYPKQNRTVKISLDGGLNWKIGNVTPQSSTTFGNDLAVASWTFSELESLGINGIAPNIKIQRVRNGCTSDQERDSFIYISDDLPLTASYSKTNETAVDSNDGSISLNVSGGSGNYSFLWNDGITTKNRSGLSSGLYIVTVTDDITGEEVVLNITITEPSAPPSNTGTLLRVPMANPITFVVQPAADFCAEPQAFDNVLLCEQEFDGFEKVNYFQPVAKCDILQLQVESDFQSHIVELFDYMTDLLMRTFAVTLAEENIGVTDDFNITIRNHGSGKSRIYFPGGRIPIPLTIGETFEVVNNLDGFNGTYSIVDIVNDEMTGQQYLVINKTYLIGASTSAGVGRFLSDAADYNVFESVMNFDSLPDGNYYLKLTAISDNTAVAISEPIVLAEEHKGTVEVIYRNNDNGYGDITWTTGFTGKIRLPGHIGHIRNPGGERSVSRDADYSLVKVNAKKTRTMKLEVWMLPPYMHEKASVIFDCDFYTINKVEMQSADAYDDPKYISRFLLANSSINVQQKGWFKKYNSDDIGTVDNENFVAVNTKDNLVKLK